MIQEIELNLDNFGPALDALAKQIDDAGTKPETVVSAATALFQGMAATAMLQGGQPSSPGTCSWDGTFSQGRLFLFNPKAQFSCNIQMGLLQACTLSGASGIVWSMLRSPKGLHVTVNSPRSGSLHDLLFSLDGQVKDEKNLSGKINEMKDILAGIYSTPTKNLPDYKPSSPPIEVDHGVPDIESLEDVKSSGNNGNVQMDSLPGSAPGRTPIESGKPGVPRVPSVKADDRGVINIAGQFVGMGVAGIASAISNKAPPEIIPSPSKIPSPTERKPDEVSLVLIGKDEKKIKIGSFPCVVGRTEENDLRLQHERISRKHARMTFDGNYFWLEDCGSSNGTFLNGKKLSAKAQLAHADQIAFADQSFSVDLGPMGEKAKATVAFSMEDKLREQERKKQEKIQSAPKQEVQPPPPPAREPPRKVSPPSPEPSRVVSPPPPPPPVSEISRPERAPPPTPPSKQVQKSAQACLKCGGEIDPEAIFCPHCGKKTRPEPTKCHFCGAALRGSERFCPQCGKDNQEWEKQIQPSSRSGNIADGGEPDAPPPPPARGKSPKRGRKTPSSEDLEDLDQTGETDNEEKKKEPVSSAPSLRIWALIFGCLLVIDRVVLIDKLGQKVMDEAIFQHPLAIGFWAVFFSFIAGANVGFFRKLTWWTMLAFLGYEGFLKFELIQQVANTPGMLETQPINILPLSVLFFAFILFVQSWRK